MVTITAILIPDIKVVIKTFPPNTLLVFSKTSKGIKKVDIPVVRKNCIFTKTNSIIILITKIKNISNKSKKKGVNNG